MGKKRERNVTVFGSIEGDREREFFLHLQEIYEPHNNGVAYTSSSSTGGSADHRVSVALRECHKRHRAFAWLDEDFEPDQPLGVEIRKELAKLWLIPNAAMRDFLNCPLAQLQTRFNAAQRNPILIVSQPVAVEAFILKVLGQHLPVAQYIPSDRKKQQQALTNKLEQLIGTEEELAFYRRSLPREVLEQARSNCPELDLLIRMITK